MEQTVKRRLGTIVVQRRDLFGTFQYKKDTNLHSQNSSLFYMKKKNWFYSRKNREIAIGVPRVVEGF